MKIQVDFWSMSILLQHFLPLPILHPHPHFVVVVATTHKCCLLILAKNSSCC